MDKGACISFRGNRYETKPSLIGCEVEISYDPMNPESITVHYRGMEPFSSSPLKIGQYCDSKPSLPASMLPQEAETSRMLDALEHRHSEAKERMADAISFASYRKEG